MEKKTTKTTTPVASACEQYVVEELKQTKQELKTLDFNYQELKSKYIHLWEKLVLTLADKESREEPSRISDDVISVYVLGGYVGCYSKWGIEQHSEDDLKMKALADLIELVQRTPFGGE